MLLHKVSGERYPVEFLPLTPADVRIQMNDWEENFDWTIYFGKPNVEVYKMVIKGDDVIQGAIALERMEDHIFMLLIESAPHNRTERLFKPIGLHLFAFCCKRSIELGHNGFIALDAKTELVDYYSRAMGAVHLRGPRMIINDGVALQLVNVYLGER